MCSVYMLKKTVAVFEVFGKELVQRLNCFLSTCVNCHQKVNMLFLLGATTYIYIHKLAFAISILHTPVIHLQFAARLPEQGDRETSAAVV